MSKLECLFGFHKPKWILFEHNGWYTPEKRCQLCNKLLREHIPQRDKDDAQSIVYYLNEIIFGYGEKVE